MDQNAPAPFAGTVPTKPLAGLVVVLFVVTVIGGWLYVDSVRGELEMQIRALETRQAWMSQQANGRVTAPTTTNGWHRIVSVKHGYAMMLPPGYHFLEPTNDQEPAYVLPDPNEDDDNPSPVMTIAVTDINDKESRFGKRIRVGNTLYWLSLWQGTDWEPYDQVAETFQTL